MREVLIRHGNNNTDNSNNLSPGNSDVRSLTRLLCYDLRGNTSPIRIQTILQLFVFVKSSPKLDYDYIYCISLLYFNDEYIAKKT